MQNSYHVAAQTAFRPLKSLGRIGSDDERKAAEELREVIAAWLAAKVSTEAGK